jgi:hypothetical protein
MELGAATLFNERLIDKMIKRMKATTKPTTSAAHPAKGPFTIRYERGNKANMIVRNAKSTEVLKFSVEKLALDLQGYNFTLDQTTYRIMSKFGVDVIEMLREVERGGGPEAEWAKQSGGPFIITSKVGKGDDKYLVCDKGVILNYSQQIKSAWRTANGPKVRFAGAQKQDRQTPSATPVGGNRYQAFEEEEEIKVEDVNENSTAGGLTVTWQ